MTEDTSPDKYLLKALNKKRLKQQVTYEQILEGDNLAQRKCQLAKGKQGEVRDDVEYYWSDGEGMTYTPAPHRYPIYRTNIPRKQFKPAFTF